MISKIKEKMYKFYRSHGISMYSFKLKKQERQKIFRDQLSIVCIAKYEEDYIDEWIRYHLLQGVDRIYVYDNESPDHMKRVLMPYITSGKVVYNFIPGRGKQLEAYNDAIQKYKNCTKYMAFIDVDEFLVQEEPSKSLIDTVEEIMNKNCWSGGIAVNWRVYGSSGYELKPEGLVIENYLYRGDGLAKGNDCIKTIANPRFIQKYEHDHYPTYYLGFHNINENGQVVPSWFNINEQTRFIRINHYFTKSKEEWILRRSRGKADTLNEEDKRSIEEFYEHDNNDIYDDIMLPYIKKLKNIN